jgi:hypothetical protein
MLQKLADLCLCMCAASLFCNLGHLQPYGTYQSADGVFHASTSTFNVVCQHACRLWDRCDSVAASQAPVLLRQAKQLSPS